MTALLMPLSIMDWIDPLFLLDQFGPALFWLGIIVLFVECGLFFPFLPGDTLLFAMGMFIAFGDQVDDDGRRLGIDIIPGANFGDLLLALAVYTAAAFAGNIVGFEIGWRIGPRIYHREGRIIKRKYLDQTSAFFEKHGHSALVIGRFVPFVRTYITLVAGVTRMSRQRFYAWSAIGAVLWVISITVVGYILGKSFPELGHYIDYITYGLLGLSVVGIAIEWVKKRREKDPGVPVAYEDEWKAEQAAEPAPE